MEEKELTEVPLSNREVLKVLKARKRAERVEDTNTEDTDTENTTELHHPRTQEMLEYLESVEKGPYKYPLEILRNIRGLEADLTTLAICSNISDLSILGNSDRKKIEQYFSKNERKN